MKFTGWKTYAGAAIVAFGAILEFLGYPEVAKAVMALGGALGLVGLRAKMQRTDPK